MDKLRGGTGRDNVGQMPLFACVRLEETPFEDGEVIKPSERPVSGDCMDAALRPQTAPSVVLESFRWRFKTGGVVPFVSTPGSKWVPPHLACRANGRWRNSALDSSTSTTSSEIR